MTALTTLSLVGCSNLKRLPGGIGKLMALKNLIVDGCSSLMELPHEILAARSKGLKIKGFRPVSRMDGTATGQARGHALMI
jgi:hypothetical protein